MMMNKKKEEVQNKLTFRAVSSSGSKSGMTGVSAGLFGCS